MNAVMGFGVWGFGIQDSGFWIRGLGFGIRVRGFRVEGADVMFKSMTPWRIHIYIYIYINL